MFVYLYSQTQRNLLMQSSCRKKKKISLKLSNSSDCDSVRH